MTILKKWYVTLLCLAGVLCSQAVVAQEAPDVTLRRVSQEVLTIANTDADIQKGSMQRMMAVVNDKIVPLINFEKMTSLSAARFWRQATPEQKAQLTAQFKELLIYTYSGAMSQAKGKKIEFRELKLQPTDTDVEVRSRVLQPQGDPILLNYRVEKGSDGWKVYDVNIMGAWLVESYKTTFATEINKNGIDGLIKMLTDKNQQLASSIKK